MPVSKPEMYHPDAFGLVMIKLAGSSVLSHASALSAQVNSARFAAAHVFVQLIRTFPGVSVACKATLVGDAGTDVPNEIVEEDSHALTV